MRISTPVASTLALLLGTAFSGAVAAYQPYYPMTAPGPAGYHPYGGMPPPAAWAGRTHGGPPYPYGYGHGRRPPRFGRTYDRGPATTTAPNRGDRPAGPAPATPVIAEPVIAKPVAEKPVTEKPVAEANVTAVAPATQHKAKPDDDKQAFLEKLEPIIRAENLRLAQLRTEVTGILGHIASSAGPDTPEAGRLRELARRYRVDGNPVENDAARAELLDKLDVIPLSLALAQAVNESAWGTSRFAREGNNLFGIWTYDESKGIVPRRRAKGEKHLVRRFDSLRESVRYYLFTLNSHPAYAELRALRAQQRAAGQPLDGLSLAAGLTRYSAKGEAYVRLIRDIIRRYDLARLETRGDHRA